MRQYGRINPNAKVFKGEIFGTCVTDLRRKRESSRLCKNKSNCKRNGKNNSKLGDTLFRRLFQIG